VKIKMVCYVVPTAVAIVHHIMRKNIMGWKKNVNHLWLNLLLVGGAIFGIVDHLWNGELFRIGGEPVIDVLLGVTITVVIFIAWGVLMLLEKTKTYKPSKTLN
jgi:hypothetical protein